MTSATLAVSEILARDADGPEFGKASPLGLLLVLLLLVGTVFLIRSMNKHLRKLPSSFMRGEPGPDQAADEGTDSAGLLPEQPADAAPTPDDASSGRDEPGRNPTG
ncbi:hypothetical protein [Williamsia phyllosphaerae]|uniref:Secreted protein n=1 Tax=Williamsia phyllosphaerae TaxID=885042 RepID=A0ABQ1V277_9NOCA|nr:hypothetical protein [Williamsia phyllosphaerae]GGF32559.1 hypothetical protein GCM10007298_30570 [Williamsia phyllosphaerae]